MTPIAKIGAHLLQCKEGDIKIKDGRVHGPQGSVEFSEIGRAWYHHPEDLPADADPGGLTATAGHKPHDPGVFSYSAHAAVVAVDPDTGGVEVLDYAIVADCGTRVNPLLVEGQVIGGFSNGLGNALYEESSYDASGQPTATTLADYTAPTAPSIPEVKLDFIETPSPFSMFGMKGIGENGAIGPPAAIVNAVNDALRPLGAAVFETPVTASRVRAAIAGAQPARFPGAAQHVVMRCETGPFHIHDRSDPAAAAPLRVAPHPGNGGYPFSFSSRSALPCANFSRSAPFSGTLSRNLRPSALLAYG